MCRSLSISNKCVDYLHLFVYHLSVFCQFLSISANSCRFLGKFCLQVCWGFVISCSQILGGCLKNRQYWGCPRPLWVSILEDHPDHRCVPNPKVHLDMKYYWHWKLKRIQNQPIRIQMLKKMAKMLPKLSQLKSKM